MSTPRRVLGTGPTTTTRSTSAPRLLPAERAVLLDADEHLAVAKEHQEPDEKRRRTLGPRAQIPQQIPGAS
ncbi:hypothetical protein OG245_37830 [Streptomyces sp. NBC_01116]|uniref:hypothetical protein n=1 Tax=Streptomyces sp. NBC_01116 TaxID=2903752 RepID=UPI003250E319